MKGDKRDEINKIAGEVGDAASAAVSAIVCLILPIGSSDRNPDSIERR